MSSALDTENEMLKLALEFEGWGTIWFLEYELSPMKKKYPTLRYKKLSFFKVNGDDLKPAAYKLLKYKLLKYMREHVDSVPAVKQTLLGRLWKLLERFNGKINDEGKVTHGVFLGENIKRVFFRNPKNK